MTVEYDAIAIAAFLYFASLIWIEIQIRKQMRALEVQLGIPRPRVVACEGLGLRVRYLSSPQREGTPSR